MSIASLPMYDLPELTAANDAFWRAIARALERAIERREDELFLSGASKWLMRLYQLYTPLARVK